MTVAFLTTKPALQSILVGRYPILLIDESQDTNRGMMEALLEIQQKHQKVFCLGLFGDMMQRIYADGKAELAAAIPGDWEKPEKKMNHRCPGRVLQLLNRMRGEVDKIEQMGRTDNPEGYVRLFLLPSSTENKQHTEKMVAEKMAEVTGDQNWKIDYKALILEHHMAAKRLGFSAMFDPLYKVERLRTGLLDGSLPAVRLFSKQVLPLVQAMLSGDKFAAAAIVKKYSPLLDIAKLKSQKEQLKQLGEANAATDSLIVLWKDGAEPMFGEVLSSIYHSGLFEVPEVLRVLASRNTSPDNEGLDADDERDNAVRAWDEVLSTPFKQVAEYERYVCGVSRFDTHQGIKGLEFPRVMVVIDDEDARGFMFSYEKLFGVKEKSSTDRKNEQEGLETTIDRTRRLLYVTCSRSESSLVIVNYTADPARASSQVLDAGWFSKTEILDQSGLPTAE